MDKDKDWIYINRFIFGDKERSKVNEVIDSDWFAGNSKYNIEFENRLKDFSGCKYCITTNSGSAAIETALLTLIQLGKIKTWDKFLHPLVTFPTSLSSVVFLGMKPVFVDSDEGTYVISTDGIKRAFREHPDISFAIIPNLLGNIPNVDILLECLDGKPLILDSCDSMGGKWGTREFISYGDMGAYSFYSSHHISTMVGGALVTNNDEYYDYAKSIVFWGRNFETDKLDRVQNFLKRYSYKTLGLDAQMSAIQAGIGLTQIEQLPEIIGRRWYIFSKLQRLFSKYQNYFILPTRTSDKAEPSWFGYPLTIRPNSMFTREDFVNYLLDNKVEIRPLMGGNILNHPPFQKIDYELVGGTQIADSVFSRGLFIPGYAMDEHTEQRYFAILEGFLNKY